MDWSLGNPYAKHPLLREVLAFRRVWVYYVAMVIDIVIRFEWIFYAIFVRDIQHSAALSFVLSLAEVFRRGMWSIFRVENEHCTNVLLFRASRDVPLPYDIPSAPPIGLDGGQTGDVQLQEQQVATPFLPPADLEIGTGSGSSLRARNRRPSAGVVRVGTIVASAHAQDFERRRLPNYLSSVSLAQDGACPVDDSTDEDDDGEITTDEDIGSDGHDEARAASHRRSQMSRAVD